MSYVAVVETRSAARFRAILRLVMALFAVTFLSSEACAQVHYYTFAPTTFADGVKLTSGRFAFDTAFGDYESIYVRTTAEGAIPAITWTTVHQGPPYSTAFGVVLTESAYPSYALLLGWAGSNLYGYPASSPAFAVFDTNPYFVNDYISSSSITRVSAPVPEPATWAMMNLGFGALGLALRRRGHVLAALGQAPIPGLRPVLPPEGEDPRSAPT